MYIISVTFTLIFIIHVLQIQDMDSIWLFPLIMFLLDSVYLRQTGMYYNAIVTSIQGSEIHARYVSAFFCYVLLAFGLYYFILRENRPAYEAFILGVVIYGVFETTIYTIFKKWRMGAVILDTVWGGVLFYLTTLFVYKTRTLRLSVGR